MSSHKTFMCSAGERQQCPLYELYNVAVCLTVGVKALHLNKVWSLNFVPHNWKCYDLFTFSESDYHGKQWYVSLQFSLCCKGNEENCEK
jgi:hypothetical protein